MTVTVGVIGTGMIGQEHLRRLTTTVPGARVAAVNDIDPARAAEAASGIPGALVAATPAELIDAVDAVVVTSWGPSHEEHVLACITAGKPVFCEKPLATTADACLRIVEAEQAHGSRLVQVGFMRRYDTGYQTLRNAVTAGEIGAPLVVHCAHRNADVPDTYTSDMAVHDTAIHEIDTLRWLLGEDFVAAGAILPRRSSRAAAHLIDPQILLLETTSGVRIDIEVNVNCAYGYDIRCEVVGETGVRRLPDLVTPDWRERFGTAFDAEIGQWLASVATGHITGPSSWDGYAAAVTADALVTAVREQRQVAITMKDRPEVYR
jgi:myo-inositol 2-dehydrogenase/D-chiro-inositol 1-dehydrogenase